MKYTTCNNRKRRGFLSWTKERSPGWLGWFDSGTDSHGMEGGGISLSGDQQAEAPQTPAGDVLGGGSELVLASITLWATSNSVILQGLCRFTWKPASLSVLLPRRWYLGSHPWCLSGGSRWILLHWNSSSRASGEALERLPATVRGGGLDGFMGSFHNSMRR